MSVSFSDQSSADGVIKARNWDFGDGTPHSTVQNPNHTYADTGTYTVTLEVKDDQGGTDTVSKDVTVTKNLSPIADYSFVVSGLNVEFTDKSSDADGKVAAWSWDFGDGTNSTYQDPSHDYAAGGDYTVTLTVTDDQGTFGSTSQKLTVAESTSQAPTAHVTIEMSAQRWWTLWRVTAVVSVDDGGDPIADADVWGHWEGLARGNVSGTTRSDGTVAFRTVWLRGRGDTTFVVDTVSKDDQEYAISGQTSDTISGP
jgi:PKD repeat protein